MTNTQNNEYDRTHEHTLDEGATWVACSTLTHCPSICDHMTNECDARALTTADRFPIGSRVRVTWANSSRRGEQGTVVSVSARGIVDVRMSDGERLQWGGSHLALDSRDERTQRVEAAFDASTDPDYYGTRQAVMRAESRVLVEVYARASRTYNTCGGHKLAERMAHVMGLAAAELDARGVDY